MRKFNLLGAFLFVYCSGWAQSAAVIIKDVNVIPVANQQILTNVSVGFSGNQISHIGTFKSIPKNKQTRIIDGRGKYLLPGLADMHIHLPAIESIDTFLLLNVMAGVTHLRAMNSKGEPLEIKEKIKRQQLIAPKVYYPYIYYSDSVLSGLQADSLVNAVKSKGYDMLKIFRIANEAAFNNIMDAAQKHHVVVGGHFPNKSIPLVNVLNSKYRSIEHLGGYDNGLNDSLRAAQIRLTVENKVFNCPTLDWSQIVMDQVSANALPLRLGLENTPKAYLAKWQDEFAGYVQKQGEEKIAANKKSKEEAYNKKLTLLKSLSDANALLLVGSDPETYYQLPGYSMYEEMLAFSKAGISNYEILKAATLNAALFFGEEGNWGSIGVGKQANVIMLAKNPLEDIRNINSVEVTILEGRPLYKKDLQFQLQ